MRQRGLVRAEAGRSSTTRPSLVFGPTAALLPRKLVPVMVKASVTREGQTVLTEFKDGYYLPFAAQSGLHLKWTIRIKAEDL